MDVLSQVLALCHINGSVLAEIECRGNWAIDMLGDEEIPTHIKAMPFHYLLEGECLLLDNETVRPLSAGDLVTAPHWPRHILASSEGLSADRIGDVITAHGLTPWEGGTMNRPLSIRIGDGQPAARILSGVLSIGGHAVDMLMQELPDLLRIPAGTDILDEQFVTALSFMRYESAELRPGYLAVAERLTDLMFIQILRACISEAKVGSGLLAALADRKIARAIAAIHTEPARRWSVERLAEEACLSRTAFAERFHRVVGATPMRYVNRWRMMLAKDKLSNSELTIGQIQNEIGFSSSFTFARAFRSFTGRSPHEYRGIENSKRRRG